MDFEFSTKETYTKTPDVCLGNSKDFDYEFKGGNCVGLKLWVIVLQVWKWKIVYI